MTSILIDRLREQNKQLKREAVIANEKVFLVCSKADAILREKQRLDKLADYLLAEKMRTTTLLHAITDKVEEALLSGEYQAAVVNIYTVILEKTIDDLDVKP